MRLRRQAIRSNSSSAGPDPEALHSQLLWIWGSPRSGSTWLLQLLAHPLNPDPERPLGFKPPQQDLGRAFDSVPIDETFFSNHLAPALADPRLHDGRWTAGTINNLLAPKPAYFYSDEYADVWQPAMRELALRRIGAVLDRAREAGVELTKAPLVPIKETNGSHAADLVMGVLPRSRMLLLLRDGRDVVDSLLHALQPGGFMAVKQGKAISTPEERAEGLRWAARLWACNTDVTLRAMEAHDPERCLTLRYEDLLGDPAGEMAGVYAWAGLKRDRAWIEQVVERRSFKRLPKEATGPKTRNRSAKPGRWRENLSPEEQSVVTEICGPLLERFGYDV